METTRDMWPGRNTRHFRVGRRESGGQREIHLPEKMKRPKAGVLREALFKETLDLWKSAPNKQEIFMPELNKDDLGDLVAESRIPIP